MAAGLNASSERPEAVRDHADAEDPEHQYFERHEEAEHTHVQFDVQLAQQAHEHYGQQRPDRPGHVDPEQRLCRVLREHGERTDRPDRDERIGHRGDERDPDPEGAAEADGDVGEERAGVRHVLRHRDVADREDREEHGSDDEHAGGPDPASADRERDGSDCEAERCGGGDHEEDDMPRAQDPRGRARIRRRTADGVSLGSHG